MAYGIVNVPGNSGDELEAIRKQLQAVGEIADSANKTAEAAKTAADNAKATAENAEKTAKKAQETAGSALDAATKLLKTVFVLPSQSGMLTYDGSEQTPTWYSYEAEKLTIGGQTAGTDAGTYRATFTPKDGYTWEDGTQAVREVEWTIRRANVTPPTQFGTVIYTGNEQSPTWNGYDTTKLTIGGVTTATNAGDYTAIFTPTKNYRWTDGGCCARAVIWSIEKAVGRLTLTPDSLALDVSSLSKTITVKRAGDGVITVQSSNAAIAEAELSGTTITVTAKANGIVNITVKVAAGTNHTAPADKTVTIIVDLPSKTLADNSPEVIQKVAKLGVGANYWSVGDKIGIAPVGNTAGGETSSVTVYAFILGFNHNERYEGKGIHFQFGKNASGTDIAFVDSNYGSTGSTDGLRMNTTNTNTGGWGSSYMRQTICAQFLAALPTDWQNIITACTKYSDNKGGGSDTAGNVTATQDKIWLLAEWEVFGVRTGANSAEQNYQQQYDFYKNGNSKIKYKQNDTGIACNWWLRSVYAATSDAFRRVNATGGNTDNSASYSFGFAPGFKVE